MQFATANSLYVNQVSNLILYHKNMQESPKDKQNWLVFTQIGLQMALTIGLGTWAGYWIDGKMANKNPIATLVLSLLSIGVSLYNVIRQIPKN